MPSKRYLFESGGPERLEIKWGAVRWSTCTITLDGNQVATFPSGRLAREQSFQLPDGSRLTTQLRGFSSLMVARNGTLLQGSGQARSDTLIGYVFFILIAAIELFLVGLMVLAGDPRLLIAVIPIGIVLYQGANRLIASSKSGSAARFTQSPARVAQSNLSTTNTGPTLEAFQRQVEAVLSPETRARLQVRFAPNPVCAIFTTDGGLHLGTFSCHTIDATTGQCATWAVSLPTGGNVVADANESALLAKIG